MSKLENSTEPTPDLPLTEPLLPGCLLPRPPEPNFFKTMEIYQEQAKKLESKTSS